MRLMLLFFTGLILTVATALSQQLPQHSFNPENKLLLISSVDSVISERLPQLEYNGLVRNSDLPAVVDNSAQPYMRPILMQYGASCGQAAAVGYCFTYEINHDRNLPSDTIINQYPTHFVYNFMSDHGWNGVSYMNSLEILKKCGTPNVVDYGGSYYDDGMRWISGYDKYYNGMKNRLDEIYTIKTNTDSGIYLLKHWLYNHLGESKIGGIAIFYSNPPWNAHPLKTGTPEAGKLVVTWFYPAPTHASAIVGYNDSIRWDYNGDGKYTNDVDINDDGVINAKDWEMGAFRFANTYGLDYCDSGYCYVMYKVMADNVNDGGIWNNTVHVLKAKKEYSPRITVKLVLKHDKRGRIRIRAGVTGNNERFYPDHIIDFPIFNFQGGDYYLQGSDTSELLKTIEMGLDITPLLSFIEDDVPARFFVLIDENDIGDIGTGEIISCSLMDYHITGTVEVPFIDTALKIIENNTTILSASHPVDFEKTVITTEELPLFKPGQPYYAVIEASGGNQPFSWNIGHKYHLIPNQESFPFIDNEKLISDENPDTLIAVPLEFSFPFYDKSYDTLYATGNGYLQLTDDKLPIPYNYYFDNPLLLRIYPLIAPFMHHDLIFLDHQDGVWMEPASDHITFRWRKHLDTRNGSILYDFAVSLEENGTIRFFFDTLDILQNVKYTAGISNGDDRNYRFLSESSVGPNSSSLFIPENYSSGLTISSDGIISGSLPDSNKIYNLTVSVTDFSEITVYKSFTLTSGLFIDYRVKAGGDTLLNPGENVKIDIILRNKTSSGYSLLNLMTVFQDPFLETIVGDAFIKYLPPDTTLTLVDAFHLMVSDNIPDQHVSLINLRIDGLQQSWDKDILLIAKAPQLVLAGYDIIENKDGRFDPGDTAILNIKIRNEGHTSIYNAVPGLLWSSPFLDIPQPQLPEIKEIQGGETISHDFLITSDPSTPIGFSVPIRLEVQTGDYLPLSDSVILIIGKIPVLVLDLDLDNQSSPDLLKGLEDLNAIYDYSNIIPGNLTDYQSIFLLPGSGIHRHILSWWEGYYLKDYLLKGGNLYLESRHILTSDQETPLNEMFNLTVFQEEYFSDTITGASGKFCEDFKFINTTNEPYNDYWFAPLPQSFSIFQEKTAGRSCAVANDMMDYKTIAQVWKFADLEPLDDSPSKTELIRKYLEFFGVVFSTTGINEENFKKDPENWSLIIWPNPANERINLRISSQETVPENHPQGNISIEIRDIWGSVIDKVHWPDSDAHLVIQTSSLLPGIYFAVLKEDKAYVVSIKFIVLN